MLTNTQIEELATKMKVPLEFVGFKDTIPKKLKTNKAYIVNLDDEFDAETGEPNKGSHWTAFQVVEYPNGKKESMYFDSFGMPPPQIIKQRVQDNFKLKLPFNTKDIQSLMADCCGWFCLAWLHYINAYYGRTKLLYQDTEDFLSLFDDLNESADWMKNEYILKMFFQPEDESKRRPIEVISNPDNITRGCQDSIRLHKQEGATSGEFVPISVDVKYV